MAAPTVQVDYDQLQEIATRFGSHAQTLRQTLQTLQQRINVLEGGDWMGRGATAFYREMGDQVVPALKRLVAALESAERTTLQISQIMQQAESEAARLLDSAGRLASLMGALGPQGQGAPTMTLAEAVAKMVAQDNAAVDSKLSGFSQGVRDLIKKSPLLRSEIYKLQQEGYTIKTGPAAGGYYTDWDHKTIVIDQPLGDADTVAHIAHEVGHGVSPQQRTIPVTPTMTRDQYVQQSVDNLMHNEGEAQLNAAQVRAELKAAGAGDIGIPGTQTADYQKVYDDYAAGKITRDQAIGKMGTLMGNEHVSTPSHQAYRDYYADSFKNDWDTNIAPTRKSK